MFATATSEGNGFRYLQPSPVVSVTPFTFSKTDVVTVTKVAARSRKESTVCHKHGVAVEVAAGQQEQQYDAIVNSTTFRTSITVDLA